MVPSFISFTTGKLIQALKNDGAENIKKQKDILN